MMTRFTALLALLCISTLAHARIENPVAFIGQSVLGATAGAPLAVDTNGQLVSGLTSSETSATGAITTTSTTDVVMTSMTTTPAAGTYLVLFSTYCTHSNTNQTITASIYNNAVLKTDSVRTVTPFPGGVGPATLNMVLATQGIVVATGAAIDIRWKTSANTATCTQRTLNLVRLL